ncbi:LysM peptidoglycan-binding domain-containing protein [Nocardia sp. NPDC127579]|uniref:LysM peptidoglycan-binding domain-containing protein n=1 Tax=Nocardia sp. NPDC127579 TaxID=3345402 RepID=UPI00362537B4
MGDTLRVGEELGLGQSLTGGAYTLTLQPDGNLVLSEPGGNVVWAAQTHGQDVQRAIMQDDGNFVLYKGDGAAAWSTETNGKSVDRLVVQADRNVVLYGPDGAVWATDTRTDTPIAVEAVAAAPASNGGGRTYTVEPGDTMWAIAERLLGDGNRYQEIADASGIANADSIQPGQELKIP